MPIKYFSLHAKKCDENCLKKKKKDLPEKLRKREKRVFKIMSSRLKTGKKLTEMLRH